MVAENFSLTGDMSSRPTARLASERKKSAPELVIDAKRNSFANVSHKNEVKEV